MASRILTPPLVHRLLPIRAGYVRLPLQLVLGVAFIALLARVEVVIGPVPITGQTLGVLLVGAAYGVGLGSLTLLLYVVAGGAGLGVFAGGAAGWSYLSGATAGYLVGFIAAAALVGYLAQRGMTRSAIGTVTAMLLGNLVIYLCGLLWLSQLAPDWPTALRWGLYPFIPGDLLKIAIAASLLPPVTRLLSR